MLGFSIVFLVLSTCELLLESHIIASEYEDSEVKRKLLREVRLMGWVAIIMSVVALVFAVTS